MLVEHAVVGEVALSVDRADHAVHANGAGVEQVSIELGKAHERRDPCALCGNRIQLRTGFLDELRPEQQIFRRIARYRELRKQDDLGVRGARLVDALEDASPVSADISDGRVQLSKRDTHG